MTDATQPDGLAEPEAGRCDPAPDTGAVSLPRQKGALELDNTRLSDFKKCPRYYYLRHVRHWSPKGHVSPPILFGQLWSLAMDELWTSLDEAAALRAFMAGWYAEGLTWPIPAAFQATWGHHTPETAKKMLTAYVAKRQRWLKELEVLSVDKGIRLAIFDGVDYVAKPDKVIRYEGKVSVVDHKTTGYGSPSGFTFSWSENWHLSAQLDGYRWLVGQVYDEPDTRLWIDAALVNKTIHTTFELLSIRKAPDWADRWKDDLRYWTLRVIDCTDTGFFPKNTQSCRAFNRLCEFFDVCRWHSDPSEVDLPQGFVEQKWDPMADENS